MRCSAIVTACFAGVLALAGLTGRIHAAGSEPVGAAIVLAADVSRSISESEFELQRKGYAAAMTDSRVLRAIADAEQHGVAISFVEWAGPDEQAVVADWTIVRDGETAAAIATTILKAPRSFVGRTAIGSAIEFAVRRFAAIPAKAERRVVDVSGDGTSNSGTPVTEARDAAIGAGITINGLAIINNDLNPGYTFHTHPPGGLSKYYEENVIGGPGAFLMQVVNFDTFAEAITRKLVAEIASISLPDRSWNEAANP